MWGSWSGATGEFGSENEGARSGARLSLDVAMRMVNLAPTPCDAQVLEESCARKSRMQA